MDPITRPRRRQSIADVHFHPWNYTQQGTDPINLLPAMDHMKLRYTVLAPIPTSLLLRCGNCTHQHGRAGHADEAAHQASSPLTQEQKQAISELWRTYNPAQGLPATTSEHTTKKTIPNYYISELTVRNAFHVQPEKYRELIQQDAPLYYDTGEGVQNFV